MELRRGYLVLGLTVVLALVVTTFLVARQLTVTSAATTTRIMALNVKSVDIGSVDCDDAEQPTECTLDLGSEFTLSVDVISAPPEGYHALGTHILYGDLIYKPEVSAVNEIVAPSADLFPGIAVRSPGSPNGDEGFVKHGMTAGFPPIFNTSHYEGNIVELQMNCTATASSIQVELVPYSPTNTTGSNFKLANELQETVPPKSEPLTINCGAGVEPTATEPEPTATSTPEGPTPTITETPTEGPTPTFTNTPEVTDTPTSTPVTPTDTPTPTVEQLLGDVNRDGAVSSLDALWVLQWDADLVPTLPKPEVADVNDDGTIGDAIDALFILWIVADLWP